MSESETTPLFIVGDRYEAFADQTSAVTVSRFIDQLRAGAHRNADGDRTLLLAEGQGVTAYDWDRIEEELRRGDAPGRTVIERSPRGRLGNHTETHKHRESNVLIAGLTRRSETAFRSSLRLHNDQELQLDHQASHVQGMVVLEAARQMYVAVCERYYTCHRPEHRYSHVFARLETSFRNFLFPLDATLDCEVLQADLSDPELLLFDIEVTFRQAALHVASVRMTGTALPATVMARKERRGAERAVRYALKRLPAPPELAVAE
ncbi:AfsA-related hotdog domain-containing protein [Streptomyces catenulae]|uniref:AfsA-related hotdog domain-containing protein n=1 Tax=Streptomyces catenulae TaxID=66875 RepID=A0ABV2YZQ1_9ACTN|nr:AfsA-related hotdog domain-containing protein [Streptomyces catenulae]